ncbi:MAG: HAD-IA family hydrolase [Oscillibacter ruminantium]|uniref:HAD family hydrolase n=1 Tax=Oscillibacter ruminantium TaxID=1263547 RepID=UPI002B1F7A5D|nr:HAD-IA family hydrolase [Oscillibacter ruminantium]MEA5041518.1 HAD-IA family hydrolase [Oscillibacter ruminantium]
MFKTAIFDLDGTLLNTLGDLTDASNYICAQNGWPTFTEEQIRHMVGNGNAKLVERFTPENQRTPECLARSMEQFMAYYDIHKMDRTAPYPGVAEAVAALRGAGIKTAVFSNKADALCPTLVRHYFGDVFDIVRGKRDGVPAKPDPTGVYALMEELGAEKASTVYVGDSDVDVLTGHNAGLKVCGVIWGFRGREELARAGAELLAETGEELAELLLR